MPKVTENCWQQLAQNPNIIGGAIRHYDDDGRLMHSRICGGSIGPHTINFDFDRQAVSDVDDHGQPIGGWRPATEQTGQLWQPIGETYQKLELDEQGVGRVVPVKMPSWIEGIYPSDALPADSPTFDG
ncbi:MAG: hypothetical protein V1738_04155 [Patescibacteria group bacterium]